MTLLTLSESTVVITVWGKGWVTVRIIEDMKLDIPNIVDIFVMELVKTLHCKAYKMLVSLMMMTRWLYMPTGLTLIFKM